MLTSLRTRRTASRALEQVALARSLESAIDEAWERDGFSSPLYSGDADGLRREASRLRFRVLAGHVRG